MLHSTIKAVIEADNVQELNPEERGFLIEVDVATWHTGIRGFSDHLANEVSAKIDKEMTWYPIVCKLVGKNEISSKLTQYRFFVRAEPRQ